MVASSFSGSGVEGASLSRLFHPDYGDSYELETDMMYVIGNVPKDVAEQLFKVCMFSNDNF